MENNKDERAKVTLSNSELVSKLRDWNSKLSKSFGKEWGLSIPPRPNNDPDFLIEETCKRLEQAEQQRNELLECLEEMLYGKRDDDIFEKSEALIQKIKSDEK